MTNPVQSGDLGASLRDTHRVAETPVLFLKNCPLCGSEARMGLTNRADERSGYDATFTASCVKCGCLVARTSKNDTKGWNNESDESVKRRVAEAWNTRQQAASIADDEPNRAAALHAWDPDRTVCDAPGDGGVARAFGHHKGQPAKATGETQ